MRILHTADWHLGKILHETSLIQDQAAVLNQLVVELSQNAYDVLIVAGDVFDRSVPPPEAVSLWDEVLVRLRKACPTLVIVVITGNHDSAARLAYASRFLLHQNIHIRTEAQSIAVPVSLRVGDQDFDLFTVPWLAGSSQRDLWTSALAKLHEVRRPGVSSVLIAHLFTVGGSESDSERIFIGESEQIPAQWLDGWNYVALGHLHGLQQPQANVWYSGSPLAYSFSEAGTESLQRQKSWLRVDLVGDSTLVTPIPIEAPHPMSRLEGSYDDFLTSEKWVGFEGHFLELTLTDAALVSQPMDRLRQRFPHLLSLHQVASSSTAQPSSLPRADVKSGSLLQDALLFLSDVLPQSPQESRDLVAALAGEVGHEAP